MAALTSDRDTPERNNPRLRQFPVKAGCQIFAGSLVALNSGFAEPASALYSTGNVTVGRAEETVDNHAGTNGALTVTVARGVFLYFSASPVTTADIGKVCYAQDDQTVNTMNYGPRAGVIYDIGPHEASVWIEIN